MPVPRPQQETRFLWENGFLDHQEGVWLRLGAPVCKIPPPLAFHSAAFDAFP